jgi:type I restriction enzyme, R subunit
MTASHKEKAFEDGVEAHLLGHGWLQGDPAGFRRDLALDPAHLFAFIETTQPALWTDLRKHHGASLEGAVLDALVKVLETRGTLDVLRHGFKFYGKQIDLAYFRPAHGLNPDIIEKYRENRLVVTRQVKFIEGHDDSIDLLLSLNGLPVATAELKNPLTAQNVEHAKTQYAKRDCRLRLFDFKKRALVHFAVDPDAVWMATRLAGHSTHFLPFNRGFRNGAGNPPHASGYKTGYLWDEVWARDTFLDILARFMHLFIEEKWINGELTRKEIMVFPRYHQLDVVRKLEATARAEGAGHSYLIQHSAGSGKSNSIAWLAHRLASLHDVHDQKVFDSVVVITDRLVLDRQLQDTIYQFEHKQGVVQKIDEDSAQLAEALKTAVPIIITTLQKFPFVADKIGALPARRYAVIVDEAHSSQSGEGARKLKEVLVASGLEQAAGEEAGGAEETYEDEIERIMQSRGRHPNLSFFGFTATPKAKTLEVFGRPGPDGKPVPFHLYSMRQAIEEHFILDVLRTYTTYKTYYRLLKAVEDDPKVDKRRASAALARFMSLHPHNIAQKIEVIVEHFRANVRHRIGGKAKAMVVTPSRLHAVRYKHAFDRYVAEHGYTDVRALVAFSGTVRDPETGYEYTEPGMNHGISETELRNVFATAEYQLLLVANKYQTGYDQPLLHTMYVDKRLDGVQAVQTLSRLNRTHPGKTDTFVLDFVNEAADIQQAFQPYYEQTTESERADPQHLYQLQYDLDAASIYYQTEVEAFSAVFYAPKAQQTEKDHAEMYRHLNPAVDRFKALDEDARALFRKRLVAFINLYAFLCEVMPFRDAALEKLYTFGRFLRLRLPVDRDDPLALDDDVALKYYRLQKISEGQITLTGGGGPVAPPTAVGTQVTPKQEEYLSKVIDTLNERFGTSFTTADELFFEQVREQAKADAEVVQRAVANPYDNFALAVRQRLLDMVVERLDKNQVIVGRYVDDEEFRDVAFTEMARRIYEDVRAASRSGTAAG